ncbi:MAG: ABC transporter permease [Acidobacteria bacterium]|nr:ABC transporter permease [Acidobacteriota bacterium]
MRLAWRNLSHDRMRFVVTVIGIAFATFLMIFQGSLFTGFVRASSKVIDAGDAELWITPRGVSCVEFGAVLPARFRDLAMGVSGVAKVERLAAGYVTFQKPSGLRESVFLLGADPGNDRLPTPFLKDGNGAVMTETLLVDASNADKLEAINLPDVEINRQRARVGGIIEGFGSFLGAPYVFTAYADAARYVGLGSEETMFLLVHVAPGQDVETVRRALGERLPQVDVLTRSEFANRSRFFWVVKTGAGGALLTAGLLGFVVGLVIVSQNIYATTMENLEEFATLKAVGAPNAYVRGVVLNQALISGGAGAVLGLLATFPLVQLTLRFISWIYTPWWLPVGMIIVSLLMCALASVVSIRKVIAIEPGRVFRA